MSFTETRMSDSIRNFTAGFEEQLRDHMQKEFGRIVNEFQEKELPRLIACACSMIDIELRQHSSSYGLEVHFVIKDIAAIREQMKYKT